MSKKARTLVTVSAALLLGVSLVPASAIDLSVGGISIGGGSGSGGGTNVTASLGQTSVSATLGGGTSLASASAGSNGTGLNANIGSTPGPLLTTSSNGGTTTANVNLGLGGLGSTVNDAVNGAADPVGELLDNASIPGGGGGGGVPGDGDGGGLPGDGLTPTQVASSFGSLSTAEQDFLRNRCRTVLVDPVRFEPGLVELCRIIARMQIPGIN